MKTFTYCVMFALIYFTSLLSELSFENFGYYSSEFVCVCILVHLVDTPLPSQSN